MPRRVRPFSPILRLLGAIAVVLTLAGAAQARLLATSFCTYPNRIVPNGTCQEVPNSAPRWSRCVVDVPAGAKLIRATRVSFCNGSVDRSEAR